MPATQARGLTYPPSRPCLTTSGKLMRPSAVAYVLFLCDRPKPHATPMQVQVHTYKARPFNYGPGAHRPGHVESNVMPGHNGAAVACALVGDGWTRSGQ